MSVVRRAWVDRHASGVTLSRKGAKSRTRGRKLRSSGTKAKARVGRIGEPRTELEKKLEAHARELEKKLDERTRELTEAREHLTEALEQQTAKLGGVARHIQLGGPIGAGVSSHIGKGGTHLRREVRHLMMFEGEVSTMSLCTARRKPMRTQCVVNRSFILVLAIRSTV